MIEEIKRNMFMITLALIVAMIIFPLGYLFTYWLTRGGNPMFWIGLTAGWLVFNVSRHWNRIRDDRKYFD